jgi:hypothetical protein
LARRERLEEGVRQLWASWGYHRRMEWERIRQRLQRCIDRLIDQDWRLLELGPSERAVMHRLAVYIGQEFPTWHVDCEYNRQGEEGKRKQIILESGADSSDADPDIIVHVRGSNGPNLLAIELKPTSSTADEKEKDRKKLKAYLGQHEYDHAVFILYGCKGDVGFHDMERIQA